MTELRITTIIDTSINKVFDLARSIDLHKDSMDSTNEEVISGRKEGLIVLGERGRWRAKHLGFWLELEIEITQMDQPYSFTDEMEMIDGDFKFMKHKHIFKSITSTVTEMTDHFVFQSPFGVVGRAVDKIFLIRYMRRLLKGRNQYIKTVAENN